MAEGRQTLVLDASVLINFLGSGCVEVILRSLPDRILMAEQTFNEVLRDPSGRMPASAQRRALVDQGLITLVPLDHEGNEWFLELVSDPDRLDDGEAAAVALALMTGAMPVLDERKARRVFRDRFPGRPLESSAGLFRRLSQSGNLTAEVLRDALFGALRKARMSVVAEESDWVVRTLGSELASQCPSLARRKG